MPLAEFARSVSVEIAALPIHGDAVVNNESLPTEIRAIRRRVIERVRRGELSLTGRDAQRKLEKEYRRDFWATPMGKQLEIEFASLPGHVRVMIPEIRAIAKNEREFVLLTELAKSANSRNLIGSLIKAEDDVEPLCRRMAVSTSDAALRVRLTQALVRFDKEMRGRARHLA